VLAVGAIWRCILAMVSEALAIRDPNCNPESLARLTGASERARKDLAVLIRGRKPTPKPEPVKEPLPDLASLLESAT
jgi:hypothetical protein